MPVDTSAEKPPVRCLDWGRELHRRAGFSDTPFSGIPYFVESLQFYRSNLPKLKNEILSGLTVAIAQVPESVAFSFVAGVNPLVGLYATFFLGLITALIGGRPGMVSGAAGAMAVVARIVMQNESEGGILSEKKLIERGEIGTCAGCKSLREQADLKRTEYLFFTMWCVGILQTTLGFLQFGRLVKLIPQTVMTGFVNGLATIIFMAQLESFQELDWQRSFDYFDFNRDGKLTWNETFTRFETDLGGYSGLDNETRKIFAQVDLNNDSLVNITEFMSNKTHGIHDGHDEYKMWRTLAQAETWVMLFYVFGSMTIVHFFPKIPKIGKLVPSSLISILLCLFLEHVVFRNVGLATTTVKDFASVKGDLPTFKLPEIKLDTESFLTCLPTVISLSLVGIIESVLTLQLVDEILEDVSDSTGRCTQECLAQGISNLMSAMFQSMGGDAMIGQSTINVKSGGTGRLSTTFAAIMFLIFIVAASSVIELLPIAALTGVLFMVVIYTFDWSCLGLMSGVELRLGRVGDEEAKEAAKRAAARRDFFRHHPPAPRRGIVCCTGRARWQDSFLIILVTAVTVATNLAYAVIAGVVLAALLYAWDTSTHIKVVQTYSADGGTKTYTVTGPFFFASDRAFKNYFTTSADPAAVVIDCTGAQMLDFSAIAALSSLGERYVQAKKTCTVEVQGECSVRLVELLGRRLRKVDVTIVPGGHAVTVAPAHEGDAGLGVDKDVAGTAHGESKEEQGPQPSAKCAPSALELTVSVEPPQDDVQV